MERYDERFNMGSAVGYHRLFIAANRLGRLGQHLGAIPNLHHFDYGAGMQYGCLMFEADKDVADLVTGPYAYVASQMPHDNLDALVSSIRVVNEPAVLNNPGLLNNVNLGNRYVGGFPTMRDTVQPGMASWGEAMFFHSDGAQRVNIRRSELGDHADFERNNVPTTPSGMGRRFRAVNDWAVNRGFAGGFPTMHEEVGHGSPDSLHGAVVFRHGSATWMDLCGATLQFVTHMTENYTYDEGFSKEMRSATMSAYLFALESLQNSAALSASHKRALLNAYHSRIAHTSTAPPNAVGGVRNGQAEISLDPVRIDELSPLALGDLLAHQMAHVAGYEHVDSPTDAERLESFADTVHARSEISFAASRKPRWACKFHPTSQRYALRPN